MTMNLTLITSIVLTAALATAGTYYVTTSIQPTTENPVETATVQQPQTATQPPATVAVNKETNKPVEVIVRTQVIQKESKHRRTNYIAEGIAARNKPQPHLEVFHQ